MAEIAQPKSMAVPLTAFAAGAVIALLVGVFGRVHDPSLDGTTTLGFSGTLTIGANRVTKPTNAAEPGSHPLCKERIVTPIPADVTPQNGGTLVVRIDPRQLLAAVNFTDADFLAKDGTADGTGVVFDDFTLEMVDVGETTLRVRHGGSGSPVVLLHGHPRTHTTWYAVA